MLSRAIFTYIYWLSFLFSILIRIVHIYFCLASVTLFFGFPIFFFPSSSSLRKRIALAICTGRDSVWRICLQHVILSFLLSACVHVFIYFIPFILVQSHCLPAPLSVLCLPFRNTIFNMNPIENRAQYMQCTEGVAFSVFFFSFFFISSSNVSKTLVLECVNLFRAQCYLCVCVTLFFFPSSYLFGTTFASCAYSICVHMEISPGFFIRKSEPSKRNR